MSDTHASNGHTAIKRIFNLLKLEKAEISSIYFYAILSGLVQLIVPVGIQSIINFLQAMQFSTSLVLLIILVIVGVFVNGVLQISQQKIIEKIQQQIFVRYAFEYSIRFPKVNLRSVDGYYLPELANRFFDTVSLQKSISKILIDVPAAMVQILFGMLLLSAFSPVFIVFGLLLFFILYMILRYTGPKGLATSLRESDYKYKVAGWIEEVARMVKSFKFSKGTELNLEKSEGYVNNYLEARTAHFRILQFQGWAFVSFKTLITAAMLIVGSLLFVENQINLGQFVAAEIVILTVINSVEKLIVSLENVYDVLTSIEKIEKIIDTPLEKDGKMMLPDNGKGLALTTDNVSFYYPDGREALQKVSFRIAPNEKVCIMGAEESGKSTLLKLFTGGYNDFSGNVMINDVPISNYQLSSLRSVTGVLMEQQDVFHGTLYENLTMGNKTVTVEHLITLCNVVALRDFISSLPNGFDTQLDTTGKKLSKVILQKILLVRALAGNPRLLLLEDPLHTLDEETSKRVRQYIFQELNNTTVLMTTYNPSDLAACNKVIVLKDGALIEQGPWTGTHP